MTGLFVQWSLEIIFILLHEDTWLTGNTQGFVSLSGGKGKLAETVSRKVNRREVECFCSCLEQGESRVDDSICH